MYLISAITRSTLASLLFKGLATKHTTVKWPIELVGVKSLKAKSGRWPGYVDFIFSLGRKALCFPNVVSYCRCKFDIKRCDLSLSPNTLILPTGDKGSHHFYSFSVSKKPYAKGKAKSIRENLKLRPCRIHREVNTAG